MSSIYFIPLMVSDDGRTRLPAPPGRKVDPAVIPVDPGRVNLLEIREDGLCVAPDRLVSGVQPNALEVAPDSALRVTLGLELDSDTGKLALTGPDGAVLGEVKLPAQAGLPVMAELLPDYTPPAQDMDGVLTPLPEGTYLHLQFKLSDGSRKDLYMNVQQLVDVYRAGFGIEIADNTVSVKTADLLDSHEKLIAVKSGKLRTTASLAFDGASETLQLLGVNNALIAEAHVPFSIGRPLDIEYVRDLEIDGYPKADYLKFTYATVDGGEHIEYVAMGRLAQEPVPGEGIAVIIDKGTNRISVAYDAGHGLGVNRANELTIKPSEFVRENDRILFTKDGEICASLSAEIDGDVLRLTGQGGKLVAEVSIPVGGVPTVSEVLYGFTPPPGHGEDKTPEKGTYLHLHYDIPKETDVYVNISDITGKAGPGITIDNGVIGLNMSAASGLVLESDGSVAVNTGKLLAVDPSNVLDLDANGNLLLRLADIIEPNGLLMVNANGKLDINLDKLAIGVSGDSGNILINGRDGRPYMPADLGNLSE